MGFRLKAQGCEARATLGKGTGEFGNPNGVVAPVRDEHGHNPVGVGEVCGRGTQGSSCLATLGWRTQSLWDWKLHWTIPIKLWGAKIIYELFKHNFGA